MCYSQKYLLNSIWLSDIQPCIHISEKEKDESKEHLPFGSASSLTLLGFTGAQAMAPHSSTLAWKILWTEEPGKLQFMGLLSIGYDWATSLSLFTFMHWRRKWQPTPVLLPGESQGRGSLVGCCLCNLDNRFVIVESLPLTTKEIHSEISLLHFVFKVTN